MKQQYIIVGGSRGIGKATAELLIKEGHHVHIIARNMPELEGDFDFYSCDVLNDVLPSISAKINGLVYCPGSINLKPFKSLKEKDFQADFEINVLGAVKVLQAYVKGLQASSEGSVVLYSTVAVQTGMAFHASVSIAKGAIEGLVRSLAAEWSPNIRVNGIAPSITETDLAARLLRNDKQVAAAEERHPLARIGQPLDAAQLTVFLLQNTSSWMTGQIIALDGGMSAIRKL
ncbi:SDR family NAD(P)-dependent oxidoreductase [Aureispira sp. CCB-QB1]|uniref:SDR family NAD(P)-dependent oxidoreductase n=1 Tax=Aureispira sp. CCB-QB1 TaxID=1313421 RepID=UPI000698FFB1|nr:SDR family oxidoreductase [Aureispira sp. CCB-QB1]